VIERQGDHRHACWGGGVTRAARNAGLAGAVIDGPCTDPGEIGRLGFPLWCRGVSAITTRLNDVGGRFNMPVSCGGVAVSPGDLVLADESGVLVLPRDEAESIAQRAIALAADIERGECRLDAGELLGKVYGASALVAGR
jgi:4-hydroxy-4-methyl-2-oxoglutarate aldolase